MSEQPQETAYQRWYKTHKQELSDRRKQKYRDDPEYRAKALERKKRQSEKTKQEHKPPEGYVHTLQEVAKGMEITVWTLREWRKKGYFPEPLKVGRNLMFTEPQAALLDTLHAFLKNHGKRLSRASREQLEDVTNLIHANWN